MATIAKEHSGFDLDLLQQVGAPPLNGLNEEDKFAALRAQIDKLEQGRDAAGSAGGGVTAPVTTRRPRRQAERSTRNMSNTQTFEELCQQAEALGADKGKGSDAQVKYAMMAFEGGYHGRLDLDPNKHGNERRDGMILAERYVKGRTGSTVFDTKTDSARKLISCTDKMIRLGGTPKWGAGQPLQNVNDLMTFRQREKKAGKKVDDAFNTLMRYATAQLRSETLIEGDELHSFVYKREAGQRDAVDVLESIRKIAHQLQAGKVSNCPDVDTSPEIKQIISACTKRIVAITKAKGGQQDASASTVAA